MLRTDLKRPALLCKPCIGIVLTAALAGCEGEMSWVDTAGEDARTVATLFWVMLAGAAVIWTAVIGLAVYASRIRPGAHSRERARRMLIWGGVVAPTVTIVTLLVVGLFILRDMTNKTPALTVAAQGEQWWWRIEYEGPDGEPVPAPNELRLPAGRTAEILLTADDVIHAFWVPSIGGKMDMIPGRTNRMMLTPTRTGTYRGQCAEYCGGAHAQMAFLAVVMEPAAFEDWLAAQAEPAPEPEDDRTAQGRDLFMSNGCGACHTIRGTEAEGQVGPDLTHVGSRVSLGAGILPMTVEAMTEWIGSTEHVKPGVKMPSFGMLPEDEIALIAEYLVALE